MADRARASDRGPNLEIRAGADADQPGGGARRTSHAAGPAFQGGSESSGRGSGELPGRGPTTASRMSARTGCGTARQASPSESPPTVLCSCRPGLPDATALRRTAKAESARSSCASGEPPSPLLTLKPNCLTKAWLRPGRQVLMLRLGVATRRVAGRPCRRRVSDRTLLPPVGATSPATVGPDIGCFCNSPG